ncbi:MAG: TonB-dependent receptor [Tannerellaceae bacterium]|nr:TonB-dependent receptor [Tannerellaceae bacterium]
MIVLLLFVLAGCLFTENVYSQSARVTVHLTDTPLEKVMETIEKQTDFLFVYNKNIDINRKVSVQKSNEPLGNLLESLFKGTGVRYTVEGSYIILSVAAENSAGAVAQQGKLITGVVMDPIGEPIIGANVVEKGAASNGTVTDMDGKFSLSLTQTNGTLLVSYIGYLSKEVPVGNGSYLTIQLLEDTQTLEEVVVVGYGVMRKKDITGAMTSIATEKIDRSNINTVDQMLQGRSSGLYMVQNSGFPGAGATIRIRGGNSISGGNEPLYVIDGVPVYSAAQSSHTDLNPLNTIAVSDIQSIEVLKDASATAIYGARGANGVILITTRQGANEKTKVSFDASFGVQNARKKYELLNAQEYQEFVNEAYWRALGKPEDNKYPVYDPAIAPVHTNWQDEMLNSNALMQNYTLSVSGGNAKTRFLTTLNYVDHDGIVKATDMQKLTLRANLDHDISSTIQMGLNMSMAQVNTNRVGTNVLQRSVTSPPNIPVYNEDGAYTNQTMVGDLFYNPVATIKEGTNFNKQFRTLNNLYVNWEIIKGLTFRTTFGVDLSFGDQQSYDPLSTTEGQSTSGRARVSSDKDYMWVNENILTYMNTFGKHHINAMIGLTQQSQTNQKVGAESQHFLNDNLEMYDLASGTVAIPSTSSMTQWALLSYLGRLNYGFNDKYLFTVSLRADGSSRFGKNNRWGYFPSAAVAWRASEEEFIKSLDLFSNLKIRASYGWTGNQDGIGIYPSMALLGKQQYTLNGVKVMGYGPTQVANYDLKWETTRQTDVGIEMGFFNNRLNFSADYYYKKTHDLLLQTKIPSTSGFDSGLKNIGEVENKGFELSLNTTPVTGAFTWNSDFNISFNRNKVLSLGDISFMQPSSPTGTGAGLETSRMLIVGQPLGIFYGYRGDGIFSTTDDIASSAQPTAQPGDLRFKDLNDDNMIDAEDREVIGCAQPKFFGGWNNSFSYKGFDLNIFMVFSYGNDIYNATKAEMEGVAGTSNQYRTVLNRWTEENQNASIPRAYAVKLTSRSWDYLVEDGSFLRIQNINLGYTFPEKVLQKTRIVQSARVYCSLQNFFTFTKYSGLDPEVSRYGQDNIAMGYDYFTYPMNKTVTFGVNVVF